MPIYCYKREDNGEIEERNQAVGEATAEITCDDGTKASRDYSAEWGSRKATLVTWPRTCWVSGVHPSQANELREHLRKSGVPTEVTKDGDPVYTSREHRRRALKARGMVDRGGW